MEKKSKVGKRMYENKNEDQGEKEKPLKLENQDMSFAKLINVKSGSDISKCFQCFSCTGGCPFSEMMDINPNVVNRYVQFGLKKEVLECSTIWICVGCNTCSYNCPQGVNIPAMMDTLRQMAIEEGVKIGEPDTLNFHNEVINSIEKYGRTHKLEIMMRYKVAKREWFQDMNVGVKMLLKSKLDLTPSKIRNKKDLKMIFKNGSKK